MSFIMPLALHEGSEDCLENYVSGPPKVHKNEISGTSESGGVFT